MPAAGPCRWKIFPARESMPPPSMSRTAAATGRARCWARRIRRFTKNLSLRIYLCAMSSRQRGPAPGQLQAFAWQAPLLLRHDEFADAIHIRLIAAADGLAALW